MDSKNTKYDDITLMQYADGELNKSARLRLEKDLLNNKELQDRLAVFALTRDDLIDTKLKLPKHIEDLIDEQDRILDEEKVTRLSDSIQKSGSTIKTDGKKDNKVIDFFKNYPVQSLAASVMFGLLIGSQGMKDLYTSPYSDVLINSPINEYQAVSRSNDIPTWTVAQVGELKDKICEKPITIIKTVEVIKEVPVDRNIEINQSFLSELPSRGPKDIPNEQTIKLLKFLNSNKGIENISESKDDQAIEFVTEFHNSKGYQCQLTETSGVYLIACKNKSGSWSIQQSK
jgi:hypothetical protein